MKEKGNEAKWQEAAAWELNMKLEPDQNVAPSDEVNERMTEAMAEYQTARALWRTFQKLEQLDPVDPAIKKAYDAELLRSGGAMRLKTKSEAAHERYIHAREQAKQAYLQYAKMPVEQDAWSTGGLVETEMGLPPSMAEAELAKLDADERSMPSVFTIALKSGSDKEKSLVALMMESWK